jgi:hypothetical protein
MSQITPFCFLKAVMIIPHNPLISFQKLYVKLYVDKIKMPETQWFRAF